MSHFKKLLKPFVPPVVLSVFRSHKNQPVPSASHEIFSGDFKTWEEAKKVTVGYDNAGILDKCKSALLKVKSGEAVYERDSVLFDQIQYSWGLLCGLQHAAIQNGNQLCVLDFGGSLGSSYYQNRDFLKELKHVEWCIVEQKNFVECGKQNFENDQLKFYDSIEECMAKHKPNVLLLSGVLQYLEFPYRLLKHLISLQFPFVIIDRTALVEKETDILTVQVVPESIYKASYPAWFFNEDKFSSGFGNYKKLGSFESFCDGSIILNSTYKAYWKGFIFSRINQ